MKSHVTYSAELCYKMEEARSTVNRGAVVRIKSMSLYSHPHDFPFWIQQNLHDVRDMPDFHTHKFVELIYVADGRATHLFQDSCYEIQAGDIFIINPGEKHGYSLKEDQRIIVFNCLFEPDFIPYSLLSGLRITDSLDFLYVQPFLNGHTRFHHKLNLRGEAADKTRTILEDLLQELHRRQPGYRAIIQLKMTELFILLSRSYKNRNNKADSRSPQELLVRRICGYVERHYNQKITLPDLSALFQIGVRQLNRLFNQYTGSTVIEYVHHIRMKNAKRLLTDTDEKVNVVAEMVGYGDPAFFNKLFVREAGRPPGKYREENR